GSARTSRCPPLTSTKASSRSRTDSWWCCASPIRWASTPRASTVASTIPTPAGKAADCGAPTETARHGSWRAVRAASRAPCTFRCGPIRSRTERARTPPGAAVSRRAGIDFSPGCYRKAKTPLDQGGSPCSHPASPLSPLLASPRCRRAQLLQRKDLSYPIALTIAQAALDDCEGRGYATSVVVVDRGGNTVVALRADNANAHTMENARRKAYTAMTFKMTTADFIKEMATRPVRREQTTLPKVIAIDGGVPIKVGNDVVGGVGLSGSPGLDEQCVMAGMNKVKDQLQ